MGRTRLASRNAARLCLRRRKSSRKLFKWRARVVLLESEPVRLRLRAELVTLAESRGEPGIWLLTYRGSRVLLERASATSRVEARPPEGRTTGRISTIDHASALGLTLTLLARPRSRRVASTCPVLFRLSLLSRPPPTCTARTWPFPFEYARIASLFIVTISRARAFLFFTVPFSAFSRLSASLLSRIVRSPSSVISLSFFHRFSSCRFYVPRVS